MVAGERTCGSQSRSRNLVGCRLSHVDYFARLTSESFYTCHSHVDLFSISHFMVNRSARCEVHSEDNYYNDKEETETRYLAESKQTLYEALFLCSAFLFDAMRHQGSAISFLSCCTVSSIYTSRGMRPHSS